MLSSEQALITPNDLFTTTTGRMAWLAFGGVFAAVLLAAAAGGHSAELPKFFLIVQDAPVLLLLGLFLLAAPRFLPAGPFAVPEASLRCFAGWQSVSILAILVAGAVYAGAHLVYRHFALSFDEFMAEFDARIIAGGHLIAAVAPEWRDYVPALQPIFRLEVPGDAYWVSAYLPVNAVIRAGFLLLGDTAMQNAVLAGIALVALFGVARRLWPQRPDAAVVSVLLLACSPQFLITAMTPYAMTAHLALNLVWLWLFLRDTRVNHAFAAGVGFAACGLHQVIFHPLFVAPFLLSVLLSRRWKLAAFYAAAYAAIGLFWILYWSLLLQGMGEPIVQSADLGLAHQIRRLADMVQLNVFTSISYMGLNLFRFVAWQAPLTIPLALVGFVAFRRQSLVVRDLAFGLFLTLAAVTILMPYQGHGWGYRYLHGLLGSLSLLAAYGWIWLSERGEIRQRAALLLTSLLVSLLVVFPWHAYQARSFVTPYASAAAAIQRSDAQVVLVDPVDIWFGMDLVRNDPYLRTSPKVMALGYLDEAQLRRLCGSYDVAVFDRLSAAPFGLLMDQTAVMSPLAVSHFRDQRQLLKSLSCGRPLFGSH